MIRRSFNHGWSTAPKIEPFAALTGPAGEPEPVTLPHDAVRDIPRSADSQQGAHTGYFPGGAFTYTKTFDVPGNYRDKTVVVEFEGVYRDAVVYINGDFAAHRPNGYAGFVVRIDPYLRYGQPNTITVEARAHRDSRWYSGAGIYRNTNLILADPVHVALDGVRVTTPDIDTERGVVAVATTVANETRHTRTVRVETAILDAQKNLIVTGSAPVTLLPMTTAVTRVRLSVSRPDLWSPDSPALYHLQTTLMDGDEALDDEHSRFGIRTLQLDPQHGLRINGEPVKLRGACIHHDNGPLGAAAIAARRGTARRAPQGRRVQRHPQRAQPDQPRDARRLRPARHARDGRDRSTCGPSPKTPVRLLACLPRVVGARRRGDGRQGLQPPERDHVLDRQRDPRDRSTARGRRWGRALAEKVRVARRHPVRHQRHQRPLSASRDRRRRG